MRTALPPLAAAAALAALTSCRATGVAPAAPAAPAWELDSPVRPLPAPPAGIAVDWAKAPVQMTPEKVRLGRWLFFDPRLSQDGTVSCATCHRPQHGFSEPTPHSTGIRGQQGTRKAPPVLDALLLPAPIFFWDGRAGSLAEQAKGPVTNPVEMGQTAEGAAAAIRGVAGYRRAFREVYGDDRLDLDRIADAIAAYEATRLSGGSAYDRFQAGDDGALSPAAQAGMALFFGRARCNACHLGPALTDARFHNVGIGWDPRRAAGHGRGFADVGRYGITHADADLGAFKTPTLRDVARRAPYFHDGSSPDLRDAVRRYLDVADNPWLDPAMREVKITRADVEPLVAFLEALDGTGFEDAPPRTFPR